MIDNFSLNSQTESEVWRMGWKRVYKTIQSM